MENIVEYWNRLQRLEWAAVQHVGDRGQRFHDVLRLRKIQRRIDAIQPIYCAHLDAQAPVRHCGGLITLAG